MTSLGWWMLAGGFGFGLLVGMEIMDRLAWSYVRRKSEREFRTPMHVKGKFYYVIPETEFVNEWTRKISHRKETHGPRIHRTDRSSLP